MGTEGRVDLSADVSIDRTCLEVVLRFIATGTFLHPDGSEITIEQLFDVRSLADRYQLLELTKMVESRIAAMVSVINVLAFLQKVLGTGHELEAACWELVDSKRDEILEKSKDDLTRLIQQSP